MNNAEPESANGAKAVAAWSEKSGNPYVETFAASPGGWTCSNGNIQGQAPALWSKGLLRTHSPWWVDYNHAPPGAGYLHILFSLCTKGPFTEHMMETAGPNGFVRRGCPRDFRNARMTVRMKGEIEQRGSRLHLLVQSRIDDLVASWLLQTAPIEITRDWSEQTITLPEDEAAWLLLGARHNRGDYYGHHPLRDVLRDVNNNILFVLFPLEIVPMLPMQDDPHLLRAGKDYPLWMSRLPEGYVDLGGVEIRFA